MEVLAEKTLAASVSEARNAETLKANRSAEMFATKNGKAFDFRLLSTKIEFDIVVR